MYILGVNAYHGDSSAALVKDGVLVAALEEERVRRIKHWAGLPAEAVRFCLDYAGIKLADVDFIAISRDPWARVHKKLLQTIFRLPRWPFLKNRAANFKKIGALKTDLAQACGANQTVIKARIINVEHHLSHLASSFFVSGFEDAAIASVDGFGDFASAMVGVGRDNQIQIIDAVEFPHSLGVFYTALTQFLGFWNYGDEYKVMGLSGFGRPLYLDQMRKIVKLKKDGRFELDTSYFLHQSEGAAMTWQGERPKIGKLFSDKLTDLLDQSDRENLAASVQAMYEEVFFHMLNSLYEKIKIPRLALAGGCAQNSLANGKITSQTDFNEIYIPPAAHDAGTAVGAAFYVWNQVLGRPRSFAMASPYCGPEFSDGQIKNSLDQRHLKYSHLSDEQLCTASAKFLADGLIVGWFQGRTEFGPRALGHRSILASPAIPGMREILHTRIKKREMFRPFGCSILAERIGDYFKEINPSPFMECVYAIRPEKRALVPAITHVDGTSRVQTVLKEIDPKFWNLIQKFSEISGIPMLLNTSFNEDEPIVNGPADAVNCFLRTRMDALVIGNYLILRHEQ